MTSTEVAVVGDAVNELVRNIVGKDRFDGEDLALIRNLKAQMELFSAARLPVNFVDAQKVFLPSFVLFDDTAAELKALYQQWIDVSEPIDIAKEIANKVADSHVVDDATMIACQTSYFQLTVSYLNYLVFLEELLAASEDQQAPLSVLRSVQKTFLAALCHHIEVMKVFRVALLASIEFNEKPLLASKALPLRGSQEKKCGLCNSFKLFTGAIKGVAAGAFSIGQKLSALYGLRWGFLVAIDQVGQAVLGLKFGPMAGELFSAFFSGERLELAKTPLFQFINWAERLEKSTEFAKVVATGLGVASPSSVIQKKILQQLNFLGITNATETKTVIVRLKLLRKAIEKAQLEVDATISGSLLVIFDQATNAVVEAKEGNWILATQLALVAASFAAVFYVVWSGYQGFKTGGAQQAAKAIKQVASPPTQQGRGRSPAPVTAPKSLTAQPASGETLIRLRPRQVRRYR